jgi:cell division protein FtsN
VKARVAAPVQKQAVAGKRFVQIGFFSTKAKADKAAKYLAGLGMRARIGTVRKGGKSYLAVQAGPFASSNETARALTQLRGVGYSRAVARN